MATRHKPSFDERVEEYVDSPLMKYRLRHEQTVSAQVEGNFGRYRVAAAINKKKVSGECSCPSEIWPCKHVYALRATWDRNPQSFFNLDNWLAELPKQSKASLVEAIRNMVLHSPSLLSVFGIQEFEDEDDEEQEWEDYD